MPKSWGYFRVLAKILLIFVVEQQEEKVISALQTIERHEKKDEPSEWHNHQDLNQAFYLDLDPFECHNKIWCKLMKK